MLVTVVTLIAAVVGVAGFFLAVHAFRVPPLFSRKRLSYNLELSAPLIHESANSDSSLTVRYGKRLGKRTLKDPHIAQIRLSNIGRKEVRSNDFDQATPMQLDLGVKIVGLLKVTSFPRDMPDPTLGVTEKRLNIGPCLIPPQAIIEFILLVDGPCYVIIPKNPLTGVELIPERVQRNGTGGLAPKQLVGYATIAFILFFVIKDPSGTAHVVSNVGNFLSSIARGFSSFLDSL